MEHKQKVMCKVQWHLVCAVLLWSSVNFWICTILLLGFFASMHFSFWTGSMFYFLFIYYFLYFYFVTGTEKNTRFVIVIDIWQCSVHFSYFIVLCLLFWLRSKKILLLCGIPPSALLPLQIKHIVRIFVILSLFGKVTQNSAVLFCLKSGISGHNNLKKSPQNTGGTDLYTVHIYSHAYITKVTKVAHV